MLSENFKKKTAKTALHGPKQPFRPPHPLDDYIFCGVAVEKLLGSEFHKKRISVVSDDLRAAGMDIAWVFDFPKYVDIKTRPQDSISEKTEFSALTSPEFLKLLSKGKKKTIVVAGFLATHCVLETVENALEEGYNIILLTDCTDTVKKQVSAKETLQSVNGAYQALQFRYSPDRLLITTSPLFLKRLQDEHGIETRLSQILNAITPSSPKREPYNIPY